MPDWLRDSLAWWWQEEGKWTDWGQSREVEGKVLFSEENCFDQPSLAEDHLYHLSQEELKMKMTGWGVESETKQGLETEG